MWSDGAVPPGEGCVGGIASADAADGTFLRWIKGTEPLPTASCDVQLWSTNDARRDMARMEQGVDTPSARRARGVRGARRTAGGPVSSCTLPSGVREDTRGSGNVGLGHHPTGVFPHTDAILDYRAEGTFNANHIRGLGIWGMRVRDFGWQEASKGWRTDGETGQMRLLLHATDPDVLERRLGRPASQGCVRISAAMNRFLDRHGVLDADYEKAALEHPAYAAVLRSDRDPSPLAGRTLVIIDSSKSL